MNYKIKFSHDYQKLPEVWEGTQAVLMAVKREYIDNLKLANPAFIKYDITFRDGKGTYALDFKDGLILFFIHLHTGLPFTTIRRWTPDKHAYYNHAIGQTFTLIRAKG